MRSVTRSLLLATIILFASAPGAFSQCQPVHVFTGGAEADLFGRSIASAGDVNGDGYSDLIVGANSIFTIGQTAGMACVFSGLNGDTLHLFTGEANESFFGTSVASAGDVNNDGYDDLIIGAIGVSGYAGRAYVFSGLTGDTLFVFDGEAGGDQFGVSVASAGDVNNDGYADLVVGTLTRVAYVFSGLSGDTLHVFAGEAGSRRFGASVASAGDVNADGYADLIVGAGWSSPGEQRAGQAYVFSGLTGDTLYLFTGEEAESGFGHSVASAGDVNNDGHADLIVGAGISIPASAIKGRAYVFSGLDGAPLYVFNGEAFGDAFGTPVASAGDVNGDGYCDLMVGALLNDARDGDAGRAYVFLGGELVCGDVDKDGLVTVSDLTFLINFYFSLDVAPCGFVGDVNDDGYTNIGDIVYLAQYLHNNGPSPCSVSEPPPQFDPKKKPEQLEVGPE